MKNPYSTVSTMVEEAMIVAFRKKTLLLHDDCLYPLQETIPRLTRSSLYRCLKRHDINKTPQKERKKVYKKSHSKNICRNIYILDITVVGRQEGRALSFFRY